MGRITESCLGPWSICSLHECKDRSLADTMADAALGEKKSHIYVNIDHHSRPTLDNRDGSLHAQPQMPCMPPQELYP